MSLKVSETVHCIEFSPFQHSAGLLAFGGRTGITVKHCTLQVNAYKRVLPLQPNLAHAVGFSVARGTKSTRESTIY